MKHEDIPGNVLTVDNVYYVRATSALADDRTRVLKYGETFGVFNRYGDIEAIRPLPFGLYHAESRHLSRLVLYVDNQQPLLLASSVREDQGSLNVDLTNKDAVGPEGKRREGGTVHVYRHISMAEDSCVQSFRLLTYGPEIVDFPIAFYFEADFADIFEVRGTPRKQSGRILSPCVQANEVVLAYEGLDQIQRRTRVRFSLEPSELQEDEAKFWLHLQPGKECHLDVTVLCERLTAGERTHSRPIRTIKPPDDPSVIRLHSTRILTSNIHFDAWLSR